MNLFQTAPTETHLVEFNAGKCIVDGTWIKPDTRKGKVYMDQGGDRLLHLYWKERKNQATAEDDLIIFPDEAVFSQVSQCTTGRVYLLKFKTSNERHFYWMQSKNDEKDQEVVDRVNELIRDPDAAISASRDMDESSSHAELMRLLDGVESQDPNITPENLLQFLNSMNGSSDMQDEDDLMDTDMPSRSEVEEENTRAEQQSASEASAPAAAPSASTATTTTTDATVAAAANEANTSETPAAPVPTTTQANEQLDHLRQMLANIQPAEGSAPIALSDVLTTQTITPLLNDPEICASLFPFLPEESAERSAEEVRQVVKSPQFSQALHSLSAALHTGQLGPLLTQLGLDPSAGNSVESFLIAISQQAKQKKNNGGDAMEQ